MGSATPGTTSSSAGRAVSSASAAARVVARSTCAGTTRAPARKSALAAPNRARPGFHPEHAAAEEGCRPASRGFSGQKALLGFDSRLWHLVSDASNTRVMYAVISECREVNSLASPVGRTASDINCPALRASSRGSDRRRHRTSAGVPSGRGWVGGRRTPSLRCGRSRAASTVRVFRRR